MLVNFITLRPGAECIGLRIELSAGIKIRSDQILIMSPTPMQRCMTVLTQMQGDKT